MSDIDREPYRLTCYGRQVGEYPTYPVAKAAAIHHIRTCPLGAMPWARRIRFHHLPQSLGEPGEEAWVTAAHGEWLDHHIVHAVGAP